jgi:hypothetical protein
LKVPYLCKVCGYSMIHKRCINYPKNIVARAENKREPRTEEEKAVARRKRRTATVEQHR